MQTHVIKYSESVFCILMFSSLFQHWASYQWRWCWREIARVFLWTVFIQRNPGQRHLQGLHLQPVSEEVIINVYHKAVSLGLYQCVKLMCVFVCLQTWFSIQSGGSERLLLHRRRVVEHMQRHTQLLAGWFIITIKTTWQPCVWIQLQTQCVLCSLLPEARRFTRRSLEEMLLYYSITNSL